MASLLEMLKKVSQYRKDAVSKIVSMYFDSLHDGAYYRFLLHDYNRSSYFYHYFQLKDDQVHLLQEWYDQWHREDGMCLDEYLLSLKSEESESLLSQLVEDANMARGYLRCDKDFRILSCTLGNHGHTDNKSYDTEEALVPSYPSRFLITLVGENGTARSSMETLYLKKEVFLELLSEWLYRMVSNTLKYKQLMDKVKSQVSLQFFFHDYKVCFLEYGIIDIAKSILDTETDCLHLRQTEDEDIKKYLDEYGYTSQTDVIYESAVKEMKVFLESEANGKDRFHPTLHKRFVDEWGEQQEYVYTIDVKLIQYYNNTHVTKLLDEVRDYQGEEAFDECKCWLEKQYAEYLAQIFERPLVWY